MSSSFTFYDTTPWSQDKSSQKNQDLAITDSQGTNTTNSISQKSSIIDHIPMELARHLLKIDGIIQTGIDTIVTSNLSTLAALSDGTRVFDREEDTTGTPIILYSAAFFKSGGGKTVSIKKNKTYFLDWREKEYANKQREIETKRKQIEVEMKSLGNSNSDRDIKSQLSGELTTLVTQPDVYLEDATAEGLEASIACNSTPLLFIDNFGLYLNASSRNEHKSNLLRMLDNVFDAGSTTTRRLKGQDQRAQQLEINGLGAYFASTVGEGNLKPKDIRLQIENGFLNKVLITFQDTLDKPIPLRSSLNTEDKDSIDNFARKYHIMAGENHFYIGDEAYAVYTKYHHTISDEYIKRYNNDEDLAGYIIRLLKIVKRIACIFEIATQCESYQPRNRLADKHRTMMPITKKSILLAVDFLDYLKSKHTYKIMMYAGSKNGKLSKPDIILTKIMALSKDKKVIDHRSIIGRLSKAQRMTINELIPIMQKLLNEGKIGQHDDGTYFICTK